MATQREEWYTLEPDDPSFNKGHLRPGSVISDICTEENTSTAFIQQNLSSRFEDNSSDISDVLSPDRKGNGFLLRLAPIGVSGDLSSKYLDRSVTGQEGVSPLKSSYKIADESLTQHSLAEVAHNLSSEALKTAILDLSQHELNPSLIQHSLGNTTRTTTETNSNISLRNTVNMSGRPEDLTQNPLEDTYKQSGSTRSSYDSNEGTTKNLSLSQYPLSDAEMSKQRLSLSQYPLESSGETFEKSSGDSDCLVMFNSKDSRPATIIERPLTEGENSKDAESYTVGHVTTEGSHNSQFDHSIKYGHGNNRETIGDTLLYSDKQPVGSSTPFSERPSGGSDYTHQLQPETLTQKDGNAQESSESESDHSNISKFMKKAGVDNYLPIDQRQSLMNELLVAQEEEQTNLETDLKDEVDMEKGRNQSNRSPFQRASSTSPGRFHELIPDTPSFRRDTFPRQGSPTQRSRTSQGDDLTNTSLEQYTLEESTMHKSSRSGSTDSHSGAIDHSAKHRDQASRTSIGNNQSENASSGQRSECSSLASLPQTLPHLEPHRRNSGSSSDARDEPHQYKSSDTLLGYDGRDGMSVGSTGSHPHTPRSDGSGRDLGESTEENRTVKHMHSNITTNITNKDITALSKSDNEEDRTSVKSDKSTSSQKSQGSRHSTNSNVGSVISVSSQKGQKKEVTPGVVQSENSKGDQKSFVENLSKNEKIFQMIRSPTEGQEMNGSPGNLSARSRNSPSNSNDTTYKDEKWASKVTGVLDSVTRRQNLSQRVASILASGQNSTPKTGTNSGKSTPISRRSSQGPDRTISFGKGNVSMNTEDELLLQEASAMANLVQVSKDTAPSGEDDETRRLSTNTDASLLTLRSNTTSEDEDVERITGEYKAILKGVTETVEIGGDIDALRAKLMVQPHSVASNQGTAHKVLPNKSLTQADENEEVEDALDKDVKRILAKYGKTIEPEEVQEDFESVTVEEGRHSPAGSAYDTDDTLSHRVQQLLTEPSIRKNKQNINYGNELELTGKSGDSLQPSGLGSLQQRIDEAKQNGDPIGKVSLKPSQSVSDTVNDRVRNILAEDDEEDATSKQVSSFGTRSQSRTSSIDYMNLERDLDEIQSNLESLKGDIGPSGNESNVSEQSAELLKYIEQKDSDDTLQRTRALLEDNDDLEDSTSSISGKRLDPEGHGKPPPPKSVPPLPISPLLTSGVIPMDLALDMIHGDSLSTSYQRYPTPSGQSASYSMRSVDTDTLLKNGGYSDSTPLHSRDNSVLGHWRQSNGLVDRAPSNLDSLTDREVMEINGVKADTTQEESITERVSKLVDSDANFQIKDESDIRIEYDQTKDEYAYKTPKGDYQYTSKDSVRPGYITGDQATNRSLDISPFTPLAMKPFSAYGTMESLLTSHRDKVSLSQFDKSIDAGSPFKRQMGDIAQPLSQQKELVGRKSKGGRRSPLYEVNSPTDQIINDHLRSSSGRGSSPHSNRSSPRDNASSRRSSGSLNSMSGLRPYKPPGSREFFYVESGEVDGMSETTVESTHPGSDDAVGPALPPHVYGSRKDPQKGALGTIQEQTLLSESARSKETESNRESSSNQQSNAKLRQSSSTPQGSYSNSDRERSFTKAQNWVNGNWPSKEDLVSITTPTSGNFEDNNRNGRYHNDGRNSDVRVNQNDNKSSSSSSNIQQQQDRVTPARHSLEGYTQSRSEEALPASTYLQDTTQNRYSEEGTRSQFRYSIGGTVPASRYSQDTSTRQSRYPQDVSANFQSRHSYDVPSTRYSRDSDHDKLRHSADRNTLPSGYSADRDSRYSQDDASSVSKINDSKYGKDKNISTAYVGRDSEEQRNFVVEPYDAYSEKCQNLQDKYKSLKERAETAIQQLINDPTNDDPNGPGYYKPSIVQQQSTQDNFLGQKERNKIDKDFSTPQRLGSSRLSLEMSLNDTGRKSLGSSKSLNESDKSIQSNSSTGSQDFLKYHPSQQQQSVPLQPEQMERPSNYRGPDYWSNVVKHNYDEMSRNPVVLNVGRFTDIDPRVQSRSQMLSVPAVSHENELRTIDKLERERAERLGGGRLSANGHGQASVGLSPGKFSPLQPDMEDASPLKSRSPVGRSKSPYDRSKSNYERSKSPYDRSKSPHDRSKSPYDRSKSPYDRSKSPYDRSKSPYGRSKSPYDKSPHHKSPYESSDTPYEVARSTHHRKSPYEMSGTRVSKTDTGLMSHGYSYDPRNSRSPDIQDMWERFQAMQSDNDSSQTASVDLDKLSDLLNNPVHYLVSEKQRGTIFEDQNNREMDKTEHGYSRIARDNYYGRREQVAVDGESDKGRNLHIKVSRSDVEQNNGSQRRSGGKSSEGHTDHRHKNDRSEGRERKPSTNKRDGTGGNGGGGDGDRDKKKPSHREKVTTDEEHSEQVDEDEEEDVTKDSERQKRKMAWVIKDEELHSIPEDSTLDSVSSDFTTSSEIDSDGKIVTKTTKRHLPDDPKLLKLQQKIAKQKEKYKREVVRERRRKDKISKLEALLVEENKVKTLKRKQRKEDLESSRSTTATAKNTSTPSSVRHGSQDSTLGISDITSTSTLTHATVISEDADYNRTGDLSFNTYNTKEKCPNGDSDESSVCLCCQHSKSKHVSRSVSPPKATAVKRTTHTQSHSASPARRKKEKETATKPTELKLQQVKYSPTHDKSYSEMERPSRKSVYLEIEIPKSGGMPKVKRQSVSPSKRKEKENLENIKRKGQESQKSRKSHVSPALRPRSRSNNARDDHKSTAVQVTPRNNKTKTRDFGATCPTPMVTSPPVERTVRKVTMKSEAIQTDRNKSSPPKNEKSNNTTRRVMRQGHSPGMFTPETSECDETPRANIKQRPDWKKTKAEMKKKMVQAAQAGVSWFVPMPEPKPWRKPLRERQANALALETWPQMDEFTRRKVEAMTLGYTNGKNTHMTKSFDHDNLPPQKTDLQSVFEKRMEKFISKSRERQKHISLRSEERKISEIHRTEREKLFHVSKKKEANIEAHPFSELHYRPKKRSMTKQQMKQLTKKKYAKLPEVTQKSEDKKREEAYKTNRLRAQMYKKRIQSKVLQKKPQIVRE